MTLFFYLWQATPHMFAICLTILSLDFFVQTFIKGDSSKEAVFISVTVLLLYTTYFAFVYILALYIFVLISPRLPVTFTIKQERRKPVKKALYLISLILIPAVFILVLGQFKLMNADYNVLNECSYGLSDFIRMLIQNMYEIRYRLLLYLAIGIAAYLFSKLYPVTGKRISLASAVVILLLVYAITFFNEFFSIMPRIQSYSVLGWHSAFKYTDEYAGEDDGFLMLTGRTRDERFLFSYLVEKHGRKGLVFPEPETGPRGLDLGKKYESLNRRDGAADSIAPVKELFLGSDAVWVFNYCHIDFVCHAGAFMDYLKHCDAPGCTKNALYWLLQVSIPWDEQQYADRKYLLTKFKRRPGFSDDGILLDLFLNDYGDREKAARLIQDETFKPASLKSYFWNTRSPAIQRSLAKLVDACGKNSECRDTVLSKIARFPSESGSEHLEETVFILIPPTLKPYFASYGGV